MAYYCFLCNQNHGGTSTREHFIPTSIEGPNYQWLPVCEESNKQVNSIFDSSARDILYLARFYNNGELKRTGEALIGNGTLRRFKFFYHETLSPKKSIAFRYILDRDTNKPIPSEDVYAIAFEIGLVPEEKATFCRGAAKISLAALVYLLRDNGVRDRNIQRLFSQTQFRTLRHFARGIQWSGDVDLIVTIGKSDVLKRLQSSCENQHIRNHVVTIDLQEDDTINVEGMLYSLYSWTFTIENRYPFDPHNLRLENPIPDMIAPSEIKDFTSSEDRIVLMNPDFLGKEPTIPQHWRND